MVTNSIFVSFFPKELLPVFTPSTKFMYVGPAAENPFTRLRNASFEALYINDEINFGEGEGGASEKLDGHGRTVDGSDGSVRIIRMRGWIAFEQEIDKFGYRLNDSAPVFGDFASDTEGPVLVPGSIDDFALNFDITIPVAELKGTNTIVAVVKLADGTIIELDEKIKPANSWTSINTKFTYIGSPDYTHDGENKLGDLSGDNSVSADDLTVLARHVAKIEVITDPEILKAADVNCDGEVDASDLTMLARYVAKIIDKLG